MKINLDPEAWSIDIQTEQKTDIKTDISPVAIPKNSIFKSYKLFWQNYTKTDLRTRRSDFWNAVLINIVFAVICALIAYLLLNIFPAGIGLAAAYYIATIIPCVTLTIRRLHDTGRDGSDILAAFIPIVGQILLLVWLAEDSSADDNKFGPNPKIAFSAAEPMQRVCPYCNAEFHANAKFCHKCGKKYID